jgi:hypothetical protein
MTRRKESMSNANDERRLRDSVPCERCGVRQAEHICDECAAEDEDDPLINDACFGQDNPFMTADDDEPW